MAAPAAVIVQPHEYLMAAAERHAAAFGPDQATGQAPGGVAGLVSVTAKPPVTAAPKPRRKRVTK